MRCGVSGRSHPALCVGWGHCVRLLPSELSTQKAGQQIAIRICGWARQHPSAPVSTRQHPSAPASTGQHPLAPVSTRQRPSASVSISMRMPLSSPSPVCSRVSTRPSPHTPLPSFHGWGSRCKGKATNVRATLRATLRSARCRMHFACSAALSQRWRRSPRQTQALRVECGVVGGVTSSAVECEGNQNV